MGAEKDGALLVPVQEDARWKAGTASVASLHPFHQDGGTAGKKELLDGSTFDFQVNFSPVSPPRT